MAYRRRVLAGLLDELLAELPAVLLVGPEGVREDHNGVAAGPGRLSAWTSWSGCGFPG